MRYYFKTSFRRKRKNFLIRRKQTKNKKVGISLANFTDYVDFLKDI